jgi:hypothetical protein
MNRRARLLVSSILAASLAACTLPGAVSPTPFTFPTPNLTHTAIFATTPSETPPPLTQVPPESTITVTVTGSPSAIPTSSAVTPLATATSSTLSSRLNGSPVTAAFLSALPVIDGDPGEWTTTPYTANETAPLAGENWTGVSDLSATYYIGWDASFLYIAVRRTDDKFVQISWGRYMYRGDDVEIQLDTDLAGDYYTTTMSSDDYQVGLSPGNFGTIDPEVYRWYPRYLESWLNTATIAAKSAGEGYNLEAKIPWSAFGVTPATGSRFGFALSLSDNDLAGTSIWQSMVSSVNTRLTTDPTTWGTLILGEPSGK